MIDVIIPAYNSHKTIERTLFSIAYQVIIDKINVYVVNDCSDKDYSDFVDFFSKFMDIKELKLERNSGPGVARKHGILNSNSKYIVFIDSDDVFYDCFSIKRLYDAIESSSSSVAIGNFIEEVDNDFCNHKRDNIWLHGKIYRRSFLIDNDINFNDSRANEDNGFNQLIFLCDSSVTYLDFDVYIWCNNLNSITRKNNHSALFDLLLGYIYNITWALEEAIHRKCDYSKIADLSFSSLVAIYCHYLKFIGYSNAFRIVSLSKKIKKISDSYFLPLDRRLSILDAQFRSMYDFGSNMCLLEATITFNEFLKLIDEVNDD